MLLDVYSQTTCHGFNCPLIALNSEHLLYAHINSYHSLLHHFRLSIVWYHHSDQVLIWYNHHCHMQHLYNLRHNINNYYTKLHCLVCLCMRHGRSKEAIRPRVEYWCISQQSELESTTGGACHSTSYGQDRQLNGCVSPARYRAPDLHLGGIYKQL